MNSNISSKNTRALEIKFWRYTFYPDLAAPGAAVWACDLHDGFPAVVPRELQMEEQQSSLEDIKETFKMLELLWNNWHREAYGCHLAR
jgi:hypothetical protein